MKWDEIIISEEVAEQVRKICYDNWGLKENGTKRN